MSFDTSVVKYDEKVIFKLRSLYQKYGYRQYKMSKFEEYDLYVRNKNFLLSDNIITFTDTDGKLMALKPDVTLSIVKNSKDNPGFSERVYYNENVYRVSPGTRCFKEIMQTGIECIGDIDTYCIYEVLLLACESLKSVSADYVLDISHLGIISYAIDTLNLTCEKKAVLKCIGEKNSHELLKICENCGVDKDIALKFANFVSSYGKISKIIPEIENFFGKDSLPDCAKELIEIARIVEKNPLFENVFIDFSVINDTNYYNGIVFKGFVEGVSGSILSGGQYDNLMKKMKRSSKAIGFAIYLDMLMNLYCNDSGFDFDTVILYDDRCDVSVLSDTVNKLINEQKSVSVQKNVPSNLRYRQLIKLTGDGVDILENNA